MKKTIIFLSLLAAFVCAGTSCQNKDNKAAKEQKDSVAVAPAGSIVYFDLEKVLQEYKWAEELRAEVEVKVGGIQKDVNRRQKNFENAVKDFENKINKGLMTSLMANDQQKKLAKQEAELQQYAQQKQAEIMEEQQVLMNKLADAIKTYVEEYNTEKGYSMILCNQAGFPVITADSLLDITEDILAGLNAKYEEDKKAGK